LLPSNIQIPIDHSATLLTITVNNLQSNVTKRLSKLHGLHFDPCKNLPV